MRSKVQMVQRIEASQLGLSRCGERCAGAVLSAAHSERLFWTGVPVRMARRGHLRSSSAFIVELRFFDFRRWPSSQMSRSTAPFSSAQCVRMFSYDAMRMRHFTPVLNAVTCIHVMSGPL